MKNIIIVVTVLLISFCSIQAQEISEVALVKVDTTLIAQEDFIVLTKEEAEGVKGLYGVYSEINPIHIKDDKFILPAKVLEDADLKDLKIKVKDKEKRKVKKNELIIEENIN